MKAGRPDASATAGSASNNTANAIPGAVRLANAVGLFTVLLRIAFLFTCLSQRGKPCRASRASLLPSFAMSPLGMQCSHVTGRDADYQPRVGNFHQHHPLALPHLRPADDFDSASPVRLQSAKTPQQPCATGNGGEHQPQTKIT